MGYVKVVKNKQYYRRFQTKMRRRRQAKTNYRVRRRLITQDKRKYNAPKWRFVVRITNKDVIAQVVCAKLTGDNIIAAAYAHELPRFGLKVGLTNYAACYCTGLLLARRLLKKLGLDKFYKGKNSLDGRMFRSHPGNVVWPDGRVRRPFKCILDVGLRRTTTGARIFGCLKGAVDGGLDIPHSNRRFPGYKKNEAPDAKEKGKYSADGHRSKIFGEHVSNYMKHLQENDNEKYQRHFSQFIKAGVEPDNMEDLYKKVHSEIRKNPAPAPKQERDWKKMQVRLPMARMPREEKIANRRKKIQAKLDATMKDKTTETA